MNWISVLEQLPTVGQSVLVLIQLMSAGPGHKNSVRVATYSPETHFYDPRTKKNYANVTHWQPMKQYEYAGE